MDKEMKEVNRQIAMGHERGRQLGLMQGIGGSIIFCLVVLVMYFFK